MTDTLQRYVTSFPNSGYRIGHLLNDLITGFILSEAFEMQYLHSPLPQKWEDFFGFGKGEMYFQDFLKTDRKNISIISGSPLLGIKKIPNSVQFLHQSIPYIEYYGRQYLKSIPIKKISDLHNPAWGNPFWECPPFEYFEQAFSKYNSDANSAKIFCFQKALRAMPYQLNEWSKSGKVRKDLYYKVLKKLRDKYNQQENPHKESYFNPRFINIAIHIRREDATVENQRFLPLDFHLNIVKTLHELLGNREHVFHIYAFGSEQDLNEIRQAFSQLPVATEYHMNQSAMADLHHMITADILIGSHSSFSDWAGFLSDNIKIYHPHFMMWDLDDHEWLSADDFGNYDTNRLLAMLQTRKLLGTTATPDGQDVMETARE
jgi:hypothetical protein